MIYEVTGDILLSEAEAIVHGVAPDDDFHQGLALELRKVSKDAGSRKADDIMDVTPDEVERVLQGEDCSTMIHGHTHRPALHTHAHGERWVLGDWDRSGWFIRADGEHLELLEFPIVP